MGELVKLVKKGVLRSLETRRERRQVGTCLVAQTEGKSRPGVISNFSRYLRAPYSTRTAWCLVGLEDTLAVPLAVATGGEDRTPVMMEDTLVKSCQLGLCLKYTYGTSRVLDGCQMLSAE